MSIGNVRTSTLFERHYRKLPEMVKEAAKEKEKIFRQNPRHPSLGTHKLHGKDRDLFAFWIDRKYRIKFVFLRGDTVLFLDIGTHDIYS